jgi:acylphosphatase
MSETKVTGGGGGGVVRLSAVVRGRVQGVGYRYFVHHAAAEIPGKPAGQVRNLPDGAVEVVAEATERATLERLLSDLERGPSAAHVEGVEAIWEENVPRRYTWNGVLVAA